MKIRFYTIIISFFIFLSIGNVQAQDSDKTVTITVSGQGKTSDEAKQNAFRSAIEQAFGTYISSKTEILNDKLIKDEIVSLANGNVQNFEVISEAQISKDNFVTTLKATVSISKLTSFVESKGVVAEFKGNLFASNMMQKILNEQAELKATQNLAKVCKNIINKVFDYQLIVSDPIVNNQNNDLYNIPIKIEVITNENTIQLQEYLVKSMSGIALTEQENEDLKKIGKSTHAVPVYSNGKFINFYFRNEKSINSIVEIINTWQKGIFNFKISNGVTNIYGTDESIFLISDNKKDKNAIKQNDHLYLDTFATRKSLPRYEWWELNVDPRKINFGRLTLKENSFLGILPLVYYTYQEHGTGYGNEESVAIIIPEPQTQVGNLTMKDSLTLNELKKIKKYEINQASVEK